MAKVAPLKGRVRLAKGQFTNIFHESQEARSQLLIRLDEEAPGFCALVFSDEIRGAYISMARRLYSETREAPTSFGFKGFFAPDQERRPDVVAFLDLLFEVTDRYGMYRPWFIEVAVRALDDNCFLSSVPPDPADPNAWPTRVLDPAPGHPLLQRGAYAQTFAGWQSRHEQGSREVEVTFRAQWNAFDEDFRTAKRRIALDLKALQSEIEAKLQAELKVPELDPSPEFLYRRPAIISAFRDRLLKPKTPSSISEEYFDWLVRYQFLQQSWDQIARANMREGPSGTPVQDEDALATHMTTVARKVRDLAKRLDIKLRKGQPGRPRTKETPSITS